MDRGKVTLKYIPNQKDRKISFGQRMEGLTNKVSKFSSDFGVESYLIVYDGDATRPTTWPQDSTIVQTMLKKYAHEKFVTAPKKFDVSDYFANKKNKAQDEITRVRKQIATYKYPTRNEFFQVMGEEQIKVFIGMVDAKIKACNQRINMVNNMQQSENISARIMHNIPQMPQNISVPMKVINERVDLTNHVSLPLVLATNKHEEWINRLFRLDDLITKLHNDYTNGMMDSRNDVDVQHGEISFMLNTAQANIISSHSSQHDVMHNIPETRHISNDPIKQLNDVINVDVPHVSSTNQIGELATLEDFLMAESEQECDPQLCGKVLLELEDLMGEPEDCNAKLDVPLVSPTNQLGGVLELDNLVAEQAQPKVGDTEAVDFEDNANWVSQHDVFANQGLSFCPRINNIE